MNQQLPISHSNGETVGQTFRVVLNGVRPSASTSETAAKLGVLFKAAPEKVDKLLGTLGYVLKRGLSQEGATKYKEAIESAGAVCEVICEQEPIALTFDLPAAVLAMPAIEAEKKLDGPTQMAQIAGIRAANADPETAVDSINISPVIDSQDNRAFKKDWWYARGGHQLGPVSINELRASITSGSVSHSDMAWCEGMSSWQNVSSIKELMLTEETATRPAMPPPLNQRSVQVSDSTGEFLTLLIESLQILRQKISRNNAYLGVLIGFAVFGFSLFLSWASIPAGLMARDGGAVSGWSELAFLAIIPLLIALYPVFLQKAVQLNMLLINVALAFGLLGYNNVINREMWHNNYGNMGSVLSVGFWIGLIAMVAISVCGVAWSLHTSENKA